jgi:dolichol-phosphate mannosyltransferase
MAGNVIIIPTYNEKENITRLIKKILGLKKNLHILVIDDNSPDGTGEIIDRLACEIPEVHACHRPAKMGLGSAYVLGFAIALESKFDNVIQMDADFSHDPHALPAFLERFEHGYDVVIGSRYVKGGKIVNWSKERKALSKYANIYTQTVTGMPIKDATGGFNGYSRRVLKTINLKKIHSNGYAFQIEMKYRAWKKGFQLTEFPIVFSERRKGESKMEKRIIWEALWMVWQLRMGAGNK